VDNFYQATEATTRNQRTQMSYQAALTRHRTYRGLTRISWVTWLIALGTILIWCYTAYQTALAAGAHTIHDIFANIINNAINVQPGEDNVLTTVLITYGAKDNELIIHGQYWRFITPIFLHANLLHIALNMFNFAVLGVFLERIAGHLRFLLIYLLAGVFSVITSFYFAPHDISVGASGAIFGLVGAYSIFVLIHRRAFRRGGIPTLLWIAIVIALNLSIGFFIQNVDNYAHVGGLLSGCILGWLFMPLYREIPSAHQPYSYILTDMHSLSRRWYLAVLTILCTLVLAILALHLNGTRS